MTTQQYKALMTLLQQQGYSTHNSSHVNQIDTMIGSSYVLISNVSSISYSMSKVGESEWILDSSAIDHVTLHPLLTCIFHVDK